MRTTVFINPYAWCRVLYVPRVLPLVIPRLSDRLHQSYIVCLEVLFCSSAVLDPRVGHTVNVLSTFISVLCHFDWLFHGDSCPHLDVVHPRCAWSSSPACTLALFLALSLSPDNSLVSSWRDHSMLASLLWQCLIVPSLLQLCWGWLVG